LSNDHPDILRTDTWITIGFTYDERLKKYALIKQEYGDKLCLACTTYLNFHVGIFCTECGEQRPDQTTGSKSLDSFIMKNKKISDRYIEWIEFSQLINIQRKQSLGHKCSLIADWLERTAYDVKPLKVMLKKVANGYNTQAFDSYKVNITNVILPISLCCDYIFEN